MYKYWLRQLGGPETYCPAEFKSEGITVVLGMSFVFGMPAGAICVGEFWYDEGELQIKLNEEGEKVSAALTEVEK